MARGFTDIFLKGGPHDGEEINKVPLYGLPDTITFGSETYFAEIGDRVAVMKGKLCDKWLSYLSYRYLKRENEKYKSGMVYEFSGEVMVQRCVTLTKAGKRCKKAALDGKTYCSATHKPK